MANQYLKGIVKKKGDFRTYTETTDETDKLVFTREGSDSQKGHLFFNGQEYGNDPIYEYTWDQPVVTDSTKKYAKIFTVPAYASIVMSFSIEQGNNRGTTDFLVVDDTFLKNEKPGRAAGSQFYTLQIASFFKYTSTYSTDIYFPTFHHDAHFQNLSKIHFKLLYSNVDASQITFASSANPVYMDSSISGSVNDIVGVAKSAKIDTAVSTTFQYQVTTAGSATLDMKTYKDFIGNVDLMTSDTKNVQLTFSGTSTTNYNTDSIYRFEFNKKINSLYFINHGSTIASYTSDIYAGDVISLTPNVETDSTVTWSIDVKHNSIYPLNDSLTIIKDDTGNFGLKVTDDYYQTTTSSTLNTTTKNVVGAINEVLAEKQDKLTFDTTPTLESTNPVTSDGIQKALTGYQKKLTAGTNITITDAGVISAAEVNVQSNWSTTDTSADSYILNKPTALSSFANDSGYDTVTSVNSKLANYLPLAGGVTTGDIGVIATASNYAGYSLPAAGALGSTKLSDLAAQLKSSRSFIGSVNLSNGVWYNIISVRHRNGALEGPEHGMYIKNSFAGESLTYNTQTASSTWIGERTILDSNNYSTYSLPLAGGTLTGDLIFADSGTDTKGIYGTVGGNDAWRLMGGASAIDLGWLELATGDAGNEPIYVRQYLNVGGTGTRPYSSFAKIVRTATLLDAAGNTSFPGTVTASAFLGNASSATKLATARTINIAGASTGSVSFDGSSDVTINTVRRSCSVGQSSDTTTNPWYKVASCSISDALKDIKITFQVNGWWSTDDIGILSIRVRSSGAKTYVESNIVWEVVSNGIALENFVLAHNTGVVPTICELWVKIPWGYYFYKFNVIEEGDRTTNYNAWTLYNLNQAGYASAPTSGYTLQASTLAPIKNNAATATKATQDGSGNVIADTYVLKEDGKGLSTNDYTNDEKTKLASISSGAEVNVQSNWSTTDKSSDSYILNKPTALSSFANDSGYDTVTSVNSKVESRLPLAGGELTGNLLFSDSGTANRGIYGTAGNNDAWRLIGGATAPDSCWLELATSDDGTEPIYVRQYKYVSGAGTGTRPYSSFANIVRSATLLDESGNTSFPGTVTASAFLGNSATSTKLATARTINIAGASTGSVSFDGSSDVTINTVRRSCSVGQSSDTTTNPWYKVASCSISDALKDIKITFQVNGWWSTDDIGILSIRVRSSGAKTYVESNIVWEVVSNGIALENFVLAHNTGVVPTICELWVKIPWGYYFYKFNVIEEGDRTTNYNAWTLYNLNQAGYASAPTSGYTLQASTLATIKNNAATATKATQDGSGNVITSTYLPLAGGTLTGDLKFSDSGTAPRGLYGTVGLNDGWRLVGGASAENSGWLELATGDDGTEPIYVRQYEGNFPYTNFGTIIRTATLLDASGNTSFPGTVTASAFSGNSATSTKLATARTINIAGASTGSVSFDGSSDVTINTIRRSCSVGQSSGIATNPWYKVASCSISDACNDIKITFQVNGWYSTDDIGILSIRVRSSGDKTYESSSIVWEVVSDGIELGDFVLAHNTGVAPTICELWVNIPSAYYFYKFNVIEEGNRTANYNAWTLYDLDQAGYASAPTSGYTLQASTLAPIKNNAATATKATQDGSGNVIADTYVLKEDGKGLSTNDYTNDEKTKLASISSGAEVNVQSNWSTTDKSSDSYILNKPTALSSFANDSGYDTVTSVNSKLASCLSLVGGTLHGNLLFSDSGTANRGIYGTAGNNDAWRLIGGATAPDSCWLELATADNGTEPIYVRQYLNVGGPEDRPYRCFGSIVRTATLLDESGNTSFPGTVTASAFLGNATSATKATQDGKGNVITSTYLPISGGTLTGNLTNSTTWTANRVAVVNNSNTLSTATITTTELGYLSGTSANVQVQLNGMISAVSSYNIAGTGVTSAVETNVTKLKLVGAYTSASTTSFGEIFNDYTNNKANGSYSHTEGFYSSANGEASHSEGKYNIAAGYASHSEGHSASAVGNTSHSEGANTISLGYASHAEGNFTSAIGVDSHSEGYSSITKGDYAHAEGYSSLAIGIYSHSEGHITIASGDSSHAEGNFTSAIGVDSHSEGYSSITKGDYAHAEGYSSSAVGAYSHSEGYKTLALTAGAHAEGKFTQANGEDSHAEGYATLAYGDNQHVQGKNNIADTTSAFIIGNGDNSNARSNAMTVDWSGNTEIAGYCIYHPTLEITTANVSTYFVTGSSYNTLYIPYGYTTIFYNLGSNLTINQILIVDNLTNKTNKMFNGYRISLIQGGNGYLSPVSSVPVGKLSSNYYVRYKAGVEGASLQNQLLEAFEDFIYYNGTWYSKGY